MLLYPLRFEPIYEYRPWGGRRLANWLSAPLPGNRSIGEAWLLSDRDDHPSRVADGPLEGCTLGQLLRQSSEPMLGKLAGRFRRFPLLLKFLDVRSLLSVQVHPSDRQTDYLPAGETGKTEAWVVLEAGPKGRVYAGLKSDATANVLRRAAVNRTIAEYLSCFTPKPGDCVLVPAGTVHALGDVVVFEVQENSDVTFRLYDWDHVDPETGRRRPLQVDQAIACVDFEQSAIGPVAPVLERSTPVRRELCFCCEHFGVTRILARTAISAGDEARAAARTAISAGDEARAAARPEGSGEQGAGSKGTGLHAPNSLLAAVGVADEGQFLVGAIATPRVLVCIEGEGELEYAGTGYPITRGDVYLLPAVVGACSCQTSRTITLLEISLPEGNAKR